MQNELYQPSSSSQDLKQFIDFKRTAYNRFKVLRRVENDPTLDKNIFATILRDFRAAKHNNNPDKLKTLKSQWGEDYYLFDTLSDYQPGEPIVNRADEMLTIARGLLLLPSLNPEDREELLSVMGYSKEDIAQVKTAAENTAVTGIVSTAIAYSMVAAAAAYAVKNPFLLHDPDALTKVIQSYGIHWGAALIKSFQNTRMVEEVKYCPDPVLTASNLMLQKTLPDHSKLRVALSTAVGLFPTILSEWQSLTLAIPSSGYSIDAARNIAGALFDTGNAVYSGWQTRKARRLKEN